MLTEQELLKKWETLTFTDDFMFSQVMHDEEICRQVVELILGIKIGKIEYLSTQEKQNPTQTPWPSSWMCTYEMKTKLSK